MNIFKKLFSKHKEDLVLAYVNLLCMVKIPVLCSSIETKKDKNGEYITVFAYYDLNHKKWVFYRRPRKYYTVLNPIISYMKNNILINYTKKVDIK